MEKILREHEIDIVISAVGGENILDQLTLIEAIKTIGTIKVKLPKPAEKEFKTVLFDIIIMLHRNIYCHICLCSNWEYILNMWQRFLPSEFGHDVDRADPVPPGLSMYEAKRRVRRLVEESGVPYTYICCNSIASWPYHDNTHPSEVLPPLDQFQIYGDGSVKGTREIHLTLSVTYVFFFHWRRNCPKLLKTPN